MHITLINPPQIFTQYQVGTHLVPPLGVAYLASYALSKGHEVDLIDSVGLNHRRVTPYREKIFLRGMTFENINDRIDEKTQLIGISNLFSFASTVVTDLVLYLKEKHPNIPIVLGGPHPTGLPETSLRDSGADFVVMGEGEYTLIDLFSHINGEKKREEVDGIAFINEKDEFIKTKVRKRIDELNGDNIPWPARHLLPQEEYINEQESHGAVNGRWTTMLSSRGCPYGCTFCASRKTKFITRTSMDVVDEMEHCVKTLGIQEFHFEDDNMTLSRKRMIEICDEILKRQLNIKWQTPNGIRASVTTPVMLQKMKDSGCTHITLAPESGSLRVIKEIVQKGNDFGFDQLLEVGRMAHKIGLKVAAYFILGIPGEKPEDVELTIQYAKALAKAGVDEVCFGLFIPLPGTPLWDLVAEAGHKIDFLDLLVVGDLNKSYSWSPYLTEDDLYEYRKRAYRTFMITRAIYHPVSMFKTVWNVLVGQAELKTESVLRTWLKRKMGTEDKREEYNSHGVILTTRPLYDFDNTFLKTIYLILMDIAPSLFDLKNKNKQDSSVKI